jgi:hypothetical protein
MHIDHVIISVRDFEAASARLRERFRLESLPGGTHPMGTDNWSIRLAPPQYLELLGVGDEAVMRSNPFGQRVLDTLKSGDSLMAWAIGVDDIEAVAARLGRRLIPGQWQRPDGTIGRWRNVFADMEDFGDLPFFIQYDSDREPPQGEGTISWIEVGGDRNRMREWIGDQALPIRYSGGAPGLRAVAIEMPSGEIVIRNEDLKEG